MFTVLIAEKEHIDAIQQDNKLFFEPFLESKELAFCYWNPEGQSLQDSVPGLLDAVGRRKNWRAVIINNCSAELLKTRNPFDVVDHQALDSLPVPDRQPDKEALPPWKEWEDAWKDYFVKRAEAKEAIYKSALERPFQKLATWLCFRPEDYVLNDVQEKQDVHDWAMKEIGRDNLKPSFKLETMERDQYKLELRMKENLRRDFVKGSFLNIAYPSEVLCVSQRSAENNYFDPDAYWTVRQDNEYSSFADRNMYFDRMRFMVFDILPKSHRNFRTDYIRFLATMLILASNPVPGSAMQARRLYQLEADTDDTPLCTMVTSYDRKLAATYDAISDEMEIIRNEIPGELTDKAVEAMFCTSKDVAVVLDESCDLEGVYAEKDYGLFFDNPENEYHKWYRDYSKSVKELTYIVKQRSRAVRKSVGQMHATSEIGNVDVTRLTPLQIDDVREFTNAAEDELVASIPPDLADMSKYTQQMEAENEKVKKVIDRRMTKKTTMILGAVCLGLFLVCFLPFLLHNGGTVLTTSTAIVLAGVLLGVFAAIMVGCLFFLRRSVVNAVSGYNNAMGQIMSDIQMSLKRFSKYLSASSNVRRGHAVQDYAKKNVDIYTKSLRIRKKHQEDIRKKRAQLEEDYIDYFGDRSFCDETMCRPYDYDFNVATEYAYPAPFLAGDCRLIEFISGGNLVTVPSSYVTRILVRMEGIYE